MKLLGFNRILGILILTLFSVACSSDLDFNQANDLNLEPIFSSNLAYFDVPANQFVPNGVEQPIIADTPTIDIFNDAFFKHKRPDFIEFFIFFKIFRIFDIIKNVKIRF